MTLQISRNPMMSETLAETLHGQIGRPSRFVPTVRRRLAGLTAGVLALSVVLASAMPVRADDNDDLVAALAALALLGVIINEADNNKRDSDDHDRPPYPSHSNPNRGDRIPAACAIEVEGRDGREIVVYAESCLDRYDIDRLPDRCAREIRVKGHRDWVYGASCLRDSGFRLESSHNRLYERRD